MSIFDNKILRNDLINISLRNKYVFFSVAKAASSTLKSTLSKFELKDLPNVKLPPHPILTMSPFVKAYQLTERQFSDILADKSFLKFAFVRNPYSRILSAYLDKIVRSAPEKVHILMGLGYSKDDMKIEISFEQFVDVIVSTETKQKNRHWMPMSYILNYPYTKFDFIGRVENFDKDFKDLQHHLNIDLINYYEKYDVNKTDTLNVLGNYYTPDLKTKIAKHYAEDFELGGYQP